MNTLDISMRFHSLIENEDEVGIRELIPEIIDMHIKADLLITAVKMQKLKSVEVLLDCGCDPFLKGSLCRTALYWAIRNDNEELLNLMIKEITDDIATYENEDWIEEVHQNTLPKPSTTDAYLPELMNSELLMSQLELQPKSRNRARLKVKRAVNEALYEAAAIASVTCLRTLLKCGGDPNEYFYHDDENLSWSTPLIAACYASFSFRAICTEEAIVEVVQILVDHGADVQYSNCNLDTPLHWAAASGFLNISQLLLRNGADVHSKNNMKKTPLIMTAEKNKSNAVKVTTILLKWGALVNAVDYDQWSSLYYSVANQNEELVKLFLGHGAITDIPCPSSHPVQQTALYLSAALDNTNICRLLIMAECNVNALCGIKGSYAHPNTPFESALDSEKYDICMLCAVVSCSNRHGMGEYVNSYVESSVLSDDTLKICNIIRDVLMNPVSLKRASRLIVRHILGGNGEKYNCLPMPRYLIDYLQLSEL